MTGPTLLGFESFTVWPTMCTTSPHSQKSEKIKNILQRKQENHDNQEISSGETLRDLVDSPDILDFREMLDLFLIF